MAPRRILSLLSFLGLWVLLLHFHGLATGPTIGPPDRDCPVCASTGRGTAAPAVVAEIPSPLPLADLPPALPEEKLLSPPFALPDARGPPASPAA